MRRSIHFPLGLRIAPFLAILFIAATVLGVVASPVRAQNQPAGPAAPPAQPGQPTTPAAAQPTTPAAAQPIARPAARPRSYTPLAVEAEQRSNRNDIQGLLRAGVVPQEQRAGFEKYYKDYALARWTDPDLLPELEKKPNFNLPDCRRELRNDLITGRNGPVHDELVKLAFDFFKTVAASPERYPAARFNAMLAIGELNQTESTTATVKPVPWPETLPVLVQAFSDANQIDALRVAALMGIFRHVVLESGDYQIRDPDQIRSALRKVAETKEDPRRSAEGQVWIRARAMDVLSVLKDPGPQNAVVEALAAIVADQTDDLVARRAAARALGRLNLPPGQGLDGSQMAVALAQLAADACAAELARMEKEAEQKPRSARGPMGMGLMGPMGDEGYMPPMYEEETDEGPGSYRGAPMMPYGPMGPGDMYGQREEEEAEDDTLNNRRRLKAFLNAAFLGLSGMEWTEWTDWVRANPEGLLPSGGAAGVTAPTQSEFVKGLITRVDELSKLCDNKDKLDRETFTTELETQLGALTEALGAASGPPASPPPASRPPASDQPAGAKPAGAAQPPGTAPPSAPSTTTGQPAGPAQPPGTAPPSAPSTTTGQPPGNS